MPIMIPKSARIAVIATERLPIPKTVVNALPNKLA